MLAIGRANHITSTGSGIVVSAGGLLVTNNHVIAGAKTVEVAFGNPVVDYAAKIVARDPAEDIALLQAVGIYGLHPLPWARARSSEIGIGIAVIGNAYGYCETPIITTGQVIAPNLAVTIDYPEEHAYKTLPDMIEVDAKVIPGDSGGVVVNSRGIILGMTTSTNQQAHVGYAIAASEVLRVIRQLRSERHLH